MSVAAITPAPCSSCTPSRARAPTIEPPPRPADRDRPVLGRHRHPVVVFGHHGRFAGDRVTQDGKAIDRADGEREEAIEILQAALQRLLQARALAHPPGQIAGRDLAVVVGLEADSLARQEPAQTVVVGERPVVHQAQVEPGRERVRVLRGHPALRGHPGVPESVGAVHLLEPKGLDEVLRRSGLLEDLDVAPALMTRSSGRFSASQLSTSAAGAPTSKTRALPAPTGRRRRRRRAPDRLRPLPSPARDRLNATRPCTSRRRRGSR